MSYDVSNIIPVDVKIQPAGLALANFASAFLFAPESELPAGFNVDTIRVYSDLTELAQDFGSGTEVYAAASRWLGGIPTVPNLTVYARDTTNDATWTDTLNKARNSFWWFWTFFTQEVYADLAVVDELATWHNANHSYFINCQTGTSATAIRDPNLDTDIASTLTTAGYRLASTFTHADDPYAGIAVGKWFAAVNYSGVNTTITAEFKKLSGVAAESLSGTEQAAMKQATKKAMWYATVEALGSVDQGRVINSWSHSTFGEWMDDVVNLEAFLNNVQVALYNYTANQVTKLGQDPAGQAGLIGSAKAICEQYIANGYLGPRNWLNPDNGQEEFTPGYEILTKPEDILDLSDTDRDARKAALMRIRIFRRGAVHQAPVEINVY